MIIKGRSFERRPPDRNAQSIFIFCEGVKRERKYFEYFKEFDSRINIEVYPLSSVEDNSPLGLFRCACDSIIHSETNPNPRYELLEGDQVWLVFDSDPDKMSSRERQIPEIMNQCVSLGWKLGESNPCFEVWLWYHLKTELPSDSSDNLGQCSIWKEAQNQFGGFNSSKHPFYIQSAISLMEKMVGSESRRPKVGQSNVYLLGKEILEFVGHRLEASGEI
jgi:hypothetical protein